MNPRMRLAECPEAEERIDVRAPIEAVWALITDISIPADYSDELQRAEWVDERIGRGARFRGTNQRKGHTWTTTCTVILYEPPSQFAWAVQDVANPAATWAFVATQREAHVDLRYTMQLGPGPSGLADAIARHPERESEIIAARIAEQTPQMRRVLEGIRERAEQDDRDESSGRQGD